MTTRMLLLKHERCCGECARGHFCTPATVLSEMIAREDQDARERYGTAVWTIGPVMIRFGWLEALLTVATCLITL